MHGWVGQTVAMQGTSDHTRVELLDAAALCRDLVADGSVQAFLADHRQQLFPDHLFTDLFPSGRGQPSVPADVVATQNIAWKVACGLPLTDPGFHPTVLTFGGPDCAPRTGLSGSLPRSGWWWPRPGSLRVGSGGRWTPPCWTTRSPRRTR